MNTYIHVFYCCRYFNFTFLCMYTCMYVCKVFKWSFLTYGVSISNVYVIFTLQRSGGGGCKFRPWGWRRFVRRCYDRRTGDVLPRPAIAAAKLRLPYTRTGQVHLNLIACTYSGRLCVSFPTHIHSMEVEHDV